MKCKVYLSMFCAGEDQFAISSGWQPRENGSQFWIGYNPENELTKQFSLRSPTAPPYWKECRKTFND